MMKKLGESLTGLFQGKGKKWLIWLGVAGIALLGLSEWLPSARRQPETASAAAVTPGQIEQALEQRLTALLEQVEGVGTCRVMVTLESDVQAVYAADSSTSAATAADGAASQAATETFLTVQTDTGPVGLRLTEIQPTVRGVAVACDGGDDPAVREQVAGLVTTALHLSSRRVYVVKQK